MLDLVSLTIHAPQGLSDRLGDFLLDHEAMTSEFSSSDVRFHGTELSRRSQQERIQGYARQVEFRVLLKAEQADTLLHELGLAFPGCGLSFWIGTVVKLGDVP